MGRGTYRAVTIGLLILTLISFGVGLYVAITA